MAELGVPGIYRSQASMAPGVKVRMGTKALPHAGIGVKSYAWSTSPLRRYVPIWLTSGRSLPARAMARQPHWWRRSSPRTPSLFSIISSFDAAYSAYNGYQGAMERFWTLQVPAAERHHRAGGHRVQGKHGARRGHCRWSCRWWVRVICRAAPGCACGWARSTRSRWTSPALWSNGWMLRWQAPRRRRSGMRTMTSRRRPDRDCSGYGRDTGRHEGCGR
jgi:hypothetical protein